VALPLAFGSLHHRSTLHPRSSACTMRWYGSAISWARGPHRSRDSEGPVCLACCDRAGLFDREHSASRRGEGSCPRERGDRARRCGVDRVQPHRLGVVAAPAGSIEVARTRRSPPPDSLGNGVMSVCARGHGDRRRRSAVVLCARHGRICRSPHEDRAGGSQGSHACGLRAMHERSLFRMRLQQSYCGRTMTSCRQS